MIGLTGTNARPSIAPTHGVENMLGTNPLVFAMPTDEPFAFTNDYATSVIQRGKIEQWAREGKPCPEGLVINQDGRVGHRLGADTQGPGERHRRAGSHRRPHRGDRRLQGLRLRHRGRDPVGVAVSQGAFLKQLGGKDAEARTSPSPSGTSSWPSTSSASPIWRPSRRPPATSCASSAPPRRRRARSASTPAARRSTWPGRSARTRACPSARACRRSSSTMRDELRLPYVFPFEE